MPGDSYREDTNIIKLISSIHFFDVSVSYWTMESLLELSIVAKPHGNVKNESCKNKY